MTDSQTASAALDAAAQKAIRDAVREEYVGHYGNYAEYNKLLRTWFVAFGIGGPTLLYTRPELLEKLSDLDRGWVIWAFLLGSAIQVLLAVTNKYVSWQEYHYLTLHAADFELKRNWRQRWGEWISGQFWIDMLCDFLSMVLFAYAIVVLTSTALRVADPTIYVIPPR
jgi:hypothetical protein